MPLQYLLVELVRWTFIATLCAGKTEEKMLPTLGKNIKKKLKQNSTNTVLSKMTG